MDNLIQQLQQTPKWKKFEEWYNKQDYSMTCYGESFGDECYSHYEQGFIDLKISFQKGVFEKFIEQKFEIHFDGSYTLFHKHIWEYVIDNEKLLRCNSFEELLIWYFNN